MRKTETGSYGGIWIAMVIVTYLHSLCNSNDFSMYATNFSTFCINTLIFVDYILIRKNNIRGRKRKVEKINKIEDIKKIRLEENSILDSIEVIHRSAGADFLKYDLYSNGYKKNLKKLFGFNVFVLVLGILPIIFLKVAYVELIVFVIQIMVGIANIIYLYIWELEQGKTEFFIEKLTQTTYRKNETNINDFYRKHMSLIMHKEEVVSIGNQSYYMVIYSKENKKYRVMLELVELVVLIAILVYAQMNGGIIYNLFSRDNIFLIIYPNLVLLLFCYYSNSAFQKRINEHKVYINEETKEKILCVEENEHSCIYYECTENKKTKSYILKVIEIPQINSMWLKIRGKHNK